ncbi:acyltransferase family protein [Streptomyces sp. R39]|uniref:Acyltransferase family protein n=1 Tax=Streptomyces sp. R39 TaxID=3238631 RepID=A0AB39QVM8_9ACTN
MSTLCRSTAAEAAEQRPDARATPRAVRSSAERHRGGGRGFWSAPRGGGRVAGLDGLRTVAVVLVIVYHVEPDLVPGGSVGVDVFFTISGFVITRLLVAEYARTGRIGLRSFYRRRWLRLMPALLVMCAVAALLSVAFPLPPAALVGGWAGARVLAWPLRRLMPVPAPPPSRRDCVSPGCVLRTGRVGPDGEDHRAAAPGGGNAPRSPGPGPARTAGSAGRPSPARPGASPPCGPFGLARARPERCDRRRSGA